MSSPDLAMIHHYVAHPCRETDSQTDGPSALTSAPSGRPHIAWWTRGLELLESFIRPFSWFFPLATEARSGDSVIRQEAN